MENKLVALLKSRKLWAALVGLFMVVITSLDPKFPLGQEQVQEIVYLLVAYIIGTGLEGLKQ